jgi:signal transduction histidine kinase
LSENVPTGQDAELKRRRLEIFRGLTLINSLNLGVVALVGALGMVAIFLGLKAREDAQKLWSASVTQARASRFGGEIGWKSNALTAISHASEVRPSLGLRNEAIAALSTPDIDLVGEWFSINGSKQVFSADLRLTALSPGDGTIEVIDLRSRKRVQHFPKFGVKIESVLFNEETRFLAARDTDGRTRAWDVKTGEEILALNPASNPRTFDTMAFAGDSLVVGLPNGRLEFYSLSKRETSPHRTLETKAEFNWFVIDPNARILAANQVQLIQIWDLERGTLVKEFNSPGPVASVAISPGGTHVAVGSVDMKVYLWRVADGVMQTLASHQGLVFNVAFDSSGRWLASCAYGGTTRLWDVTSGAIRLATESLFINRFGTEQNLVACTRAEAGFGLARLSDIKFTRSFRMPKQTDSAVYMALFDSEDRVIASRSESSEIVDSKTGDILSIVRGQRMRGAAWNRKDNSLYTVGADGFRRWQPLPDATNLLFDVPENIQVARNGKADEALRLSPDGTEALVRIGLAGAILYDLENRKGIAGYSVPNIGGIAFSADKQKIATGTFHGTGTKIWDRTGKLIKDLAGRDAGVDFSPDGKWFANVSPDLCVIHDAATWEVKHRFPMQSASALPGVAAFSPSGRMLAFTEMRRTVRLVEPESGVELARFSPAGELQINTLSFSPSGNQLVGGTQVGTLEIWDLAGMRTELGALKLNWQDRRAPVGETFRERNTLRWVPVIATGTLLAVLCFSIVSWIRHRQFVGIYRQIEADMEQRNEQLAAAQTELFTSQKMRALGTLAAGIAHDFNNLLSIIRLSNQLTAEATTGNEEAQDNARIIERAVKQGKSVVKSMLGYSRSAGSEAEYSVNEIVEQTVALLRQEFLQKVELKIEMAANLDPVLGIQNCLEQILLNLIVNAVEAMKGEGRLAISTRKVDLAGTELSLRPGPASNYVEIRIADSGPGIPSEVVSRIFEPFFTTKNIGNQRGTGLGLSMVYGICKEEGIGISVKSVVGSGTEFWLYVPEGGQKRSMQPSGEVANVGL